MLILRMGRALRISLCRRLGISGLQMGPGVDRGYGCFVIMIVSVVVGGWVGFVCI